MKILIVMLLLGVGVWYVVFREKPGSGPKARAGIAQSQPVIGAIERFRATRGAYPATIEDLIPDFSGAVPKQINGHPILYERQGDSYEFTFSYASPLPTHCTYSPSTRWKCGWL